LKCFFKCNYKITNYNLYQLKVNMSVAIENSECPICMEEICGVLNRVTTECGHNFHTNCLLTNASHNGFGCPYCRTELAQPVEEEDSSDEEYRANEFYDERAESRALHGMRNLFISAEGNGEAPQDDDSSNDESDDYSTVDNSESDDDAPLVSNSPSPAFIARMLIANGATMEDMVKVMLCGSDIGQAYDDELDEYEEVVAVIYGKIRRILARHRRGIEVE